MPSFDLQPLLLKAEALPGLSKITKEIDARSFFRSILSKLMIAGAALGAFTGLLVYLWSGMRVATSEYLEASANFAGLLVTVLMIVALIYACALTVKRATQMSIDEDLSVIDLGFDLLRLAIEILALYVLVYGLALGLSMIVAGADGTGAVFSATLREPGYVIAKVGSWIGDADGWFLVRIAGLLTLAWSVISAFLVILGGYMGYEFCLVVYRFFARRS
jgi:hypothetical protein